MNTYRCKHFIVQELVGPEFFAKWGDRSWEWLQVPMLVTLDQVREKFGPVTVNNWHSGGQFHESGLRDFSTATGAGYSQHKFGGACDMKFGSVTPAEASAYILAHRADFPFLTTLEDVTVTKTWLHGDCRNHGKPDIWVVVP